MQYLLAGGRHGVAHLNDLLVAALEGRVDVAQLAGGDDLTRLHIGTVAGVFHHFLAPNAVVLLHEVLLVDDFLLQETGVAWIEDVDLAHHLAHDHLKVLVVDAHTLQAVHTLHLVDDVLLHGSRAHDAQDVGRSDGAVGERSASTHEVVLLHQDLLGKRHQVVLDLAYLAGDHDLAVASLDLAKGDLAVDLAHHSRVARVAGLEELGDARQTAGDIAGTAARCARNLDKHLAGRDLVALLVHQVGAHRQCIGLHQLALLVVELSLGYLVVVFRLDDDALAVARSLVDLVAIGHALDEVAELECTAHLAHDHSVEGVPLAYHVALLEQVAILEEQFGTVHNVGRSEHHARVDVDDVHLGHAAYHNVDTVFVLHSAQLVDLQATVVFRGHVGHGCNIAGHTTHVEGAQCELRAWLADGLCGNHTHGLALLHHAVVGQVAAIALGTHAVLGLAGEHRAYLDRLDGRVVDALGSGIAYLLAALDDDLATGGVDHVVHRHAAHNAVAQRGHHVVVVFHLAAHKAAQGAAVFLGDDHVVSHIDKTASEVTGIGRLQGGIGKTLAGTVGRDEVLQHAQALFEVGENWVLDNLVAAFDARLLRLGHKATHTRELAYLVLRTTGARVEHHVDRVEALLVGADLLHQRVGELGVDVGPYINHLVVALVVGDETHVVVVHHFLYLGVAFLDVGLLFGWNEHIVEVERQAAQVGHAVTHVLHIVEELGRPRHATGAYHLGDKFLECFL